MRAYVKFRVFVINTFVFLKYCLQQIHLFTCDYEVFEKHGFVGDKLFLRKIDYIKLRPNDLNVVENAKTS